MKKPSRRDQMTSLLFDLTDEGSKFRIRWRAIARFLIWLVLSGFTILLTVFSAEFPMHKGILVAMSFVKYIPLLIVVYSLAKLKAAKYLDDVYELENEELAADFLEHVAFNQIEYTTIYDKDKGKVITKVVMKPLITIKDGEISEKDEESPLILIGGPGYIQVNLDSIALLERVTGEPEIIYPRKDAWRLGSFERIREIGESDEAGEREYAIINLRDQISELIVKSRTKDGIPIEARDITIMFSILRRQELGRIAQKSSEAYLFDERAVQALVYNQTTITPEPPTVAGFDFPWNATVLPLITSEIERAITSHTLNQILASTGKKELDDISTTEQNIEQMRMDITGKHSLQSLEKKGPSKTNSQTRTKITEQFFNKPFTDKASAMGVQIDWIDIGSWKPSPTAIYDKQKESWKLSGGLKQKRTQVEQSKKKHEAEEIVNLIDNVVLFFYDRISEPSGQSKDLSRRKLENLLFAKPELASDPGFQAQMDKLDSGKKGSTSTALEMLKAFRKELLAGQELIEEKEKSSEEEKQADLEKIKKTLESINNFFQRSPKKPV